MLIPAAIVGDYATAKREVKKAVSRFRQGSGWNEALTFDGTVDTRDVPGLILLDGPNPLLGRDQHIHAYLPLSLLTAAFASRRIPREQGDLVYQESLAAVDGIVGLLAPANQAWVYPPDRHKPFLNAVSAAWPTLEAEGERFSVGMATGSPLWSLPSNLKFVLARRGVDVPVLNSPLPARGIDALISGLQFPAPKG